MSSLAKLSEQYSPVALELLKSPKVRNAAAIFGFLTLLPSLNRWLSWRRANNNITRRTWNAPKEIVVVTGGSSGIGAKIVQMLESRGLKIIILDVNPPPTKTAQNTAFYEVDLSDPAAISEIAERIRRDHGHPTVLINNAGIGNGESIISVAPTKLQKLFNVNLVAPFLLTQQFLPEMISQNHGHIVNIASMASFSTQAANVDYAASKVGLLAFHEGIKQELKHVYKAPAVRATVVHPTWVQTPMIDKLLKTGKLGRYVTAEDVACAVVKQITSGYGAQVVVPPDMAWTSMIRGFPVWLQESLRDMVTQGLLRAIHETS
ncbi:related to a retinal short-chain dehydrogenase/reductase [Cephalotrichum gorgonifer]|uniref:Short-chain dehydrogenase/reductase 3 n=1 Tax=Cephalotrichum gorgonifer TaxID=2041049 RepID=A0AAE8SUR9_9PEZI|nr:related to a retinal short-chain dehydrogenase/reductase [Cephalotrichum gorgonifer]